LAPVVQAPLQLTMNLGGIMVDAASLCFVGGPQAPSDKLVLQATTLDRFAHGGLDQARERFTVAQDALCGFAQFRLDASDGKVAVFMMRCVCNAMLS